MDIPFLDFDEDFIHHLAATSGKKKGGEIRKCYYCLGGGGRVVVIACEEDYKDNRRKKHRQDTLTTLVEERLSRIDPAARHRVPLSTVFLLSLEEDSPGYVSSFLGQTRRVFACVCEVRSESGRAFQSQGQGADRRRERFVSAPSRRTSLADSRARGSPRCVSCAASCFLDVRAWCRRSCLRGSWRPIKLFFFRKKTAAADGRNMIRARRMTHG